jgi:hypothetical protein
MKSKGYEDALLSDFTDKCDSEREEYYRREREKIEERKMTKNPVAVQFARNLKHQFDLFKTAQGQAEKRCSCCHQLLPNPYTQEWLGKECGMTKATIVHYFQGNRIPSLVNIAKLAKSLGCEFIALLAEINLSLFEGGKQ